MKTALYVATVPEPTARQLMIIWRVPEKYKANMPWYSGADFQAVPTDSLQPDFSMENRMRIHRFMIITLIRKNILIWDLQKQWMSVALHRSHRGINFL